VETENEKAALLQAIQLWLRQKQKQSQQTKSDEVIDA